MRDRILIDLAVRNLRRNAVRSVLAMVGIVIRVLAIASLRDPRRQPLGARRAWSRT